MFRNDLEALASRVEQLERELAEARQANDVARAEIARLEATLVQAEKDQKAAVRDARRGSRAGSSRFVIAGVVGAVVLGGLAIGTCLTRKPEAEPVSEAAMPEAKVAASTQPDARVIDPDAALSKKLFLLWGCWAAQDAYLGGALVRYQDTHAKHPGFTFFGSLDRIGCSAKDALAEAPHDAELDRATQAYLDEVARLRPLLVAIQRYHADKDYLDDGGKGEAGLDAELARVLPGYQAAASELRRLVHERWDQLAGRVGPRLGREQKLFFDLGRTAEEAYRLLTAPALDAAALAQVEERLAPLLDAVLNGTHQGDEASWLGSLQQAGPRYLRFVKSARRSWNGKTLDLGQMELQDASAVMGVAWSEVFKATGAWE